MIESQNQEKEDANKNQSEENTGEKFKKDTEGEFESLGEHYRKNNIDNNDEDDHLNKRISLESMIFKSLFDLCETSEEHDKNISRKDHQEPIEQEQQPPNDNTGEPELNKVTGEDSLLNISGKDHQEPIEDEQPEEEQQDQQPNDNTGEPKLNKVTGEDSLPNINPDHVLNDNDANCGSKLLTRDENGENYRITEGIPRSTNFIPSATSMSVLPDFHLLKMNITGIFRGEKIQM